MKDRDELAQLFLSVYSGFLEWLIPYLKAGGPLDLSDERGDTVLHAAAAGWQPRMIEMLILWGANPNSQNATGRTPLHTLTECCEAPDGGKFLRHYTNPLDARRDAFDELLIRRTDGAILDNAGVNAFHLAAHIGDEIALKKLFFGRFFRDIDVRSRAGTTPLVYACLAKNFACAKQLLAWGANPDISLSENVTVRDLVEDIGDPELTDLLSGGKRGE